MFSSQDAETPTHQKHHRLNGWTKEHGWTWPWLGHPQGRRICPFTLLEAHLSGLLLLHKHLVSTFNKNTFALLHYTIGNVTFLHIVESRSISMWVAGKFNVGPIWSGVQVLTLGFYKGPSELMVIRTSLESPIPATDIDSVYANKSIAAGGSLVCGLTTRPCVGSKVQTPDIHQVSGSPRIL